MAAEEVFIENPEILPNFQKILEIHNQNKDKFVLEFFFEFSGLAIITKKKNFLNKPKKIISREFSFKNLIRKFLKIVPKK